MSPIPWVPPAVAFHCKGAVCSLVSGQGCSPSSVFVACACASCNARPLAAFRSGGCILSLSDWVTHIGGTKTTLESVQVTCPCQEVKVPFDEWLHSASFRMGGSCLRRRQINVFHWNGNVSVECNAPDNNGKSSSRRASPLPQPTAYQGYGVWRAATIRGYDAATRRFELKYHDEPKRSQAHIWLPFAVLHYARNPPATDDAVRSYPVGPPPVSAGSPPPHVDDATDLQPARYNDASAGDEHKAYQFASSPPQQEGLLQERSRPPPPLLRDNTMPCLDVAGSIPTLGGAQSWGPASPASAPVHRPVIRGSGLTACERERAAVRDAAATAPGPAPAPGRAAAVWATRPVTTSPPPNVQDVRHYVTSATGPQSGWFLAQATGSCDSSEAVVSRPAQSGPATSLPFVHPRQALTASVTLDAAAPYNNSGSGGGGGLDDKEAVWRSLAKSGAGWSQTASPSFGSGETPVTACGPAGTSGAAVPLAAVAAATAAAGHTVWYANSPHGSECCSSNSSDSRFRPVAGGSYGLGGATRGGDGASGVSGDCSSGRGRTGATARNSASSSFCGGTSLSAGDAALRSHSVTSAGGCHQMTVPPPTGPGAPAAPAHQVHRNADGGGCAAWSPGGPVGRVAAARPRREFGGMVPVAAVVAAAAPVVEVTASEAAGDEKSAAAVFAELSKEEWPMGIIGCFTARSDPRPVVFAAPAAAVIPTPTPSAVVSAVSPTFIAPAPLSDWCGHVTGPRTDPWAADPLLSAAPASQPALRPVVASEQPRPQQGPAPSSAPVTSARHAGFHPRLPPANSGAANAVDVGVGVAHIVGSKRSAAAAAGCLPVPAYSWAVWPQASAGPYANGAGNAPVAPAGLPGGGVGAFIGAGGGGGGAMGCWRQASGVAALLEILQEWSEAVPGEEVTVAEGELWPLATALKRQNTGMCN